MCMTKEKQMPASFVFVFYALPRQLCQKPAIRTL
jgi:hypothetical protein